MLGRSGCLSRPQSKEQLFPSRDVCCTRQQTGDFCAAPFLRFWQCGSCRRAREGWPHALRPARHGGEEGGELQQQRLRARSARGQKEKTLHRKLCGEAHWGATYARRRECENALELQGERAPAESPGQFILSARESTLDKRRRRYGRAGVHTENAWKQTRRQRFRVAGRKTSERARSTGT